MNLPRVPVPAHIPGVRFLLWASFCLVACGSEPLPPPAAPPPETESLPPMESPRPPPGSLWRDEVDAVVDGGLGRFLGFVKVEPRLDGDTFVGWQIVELTPADTWAGVDLLPGDVVTRINGGPIEREAQAYAVFTSLKQSNQLTVTYLRGEQPRELAWRIVPRPGFRPTTPAPAASAPNPRPAPSAAPGPTKK
jgi:hypothetical protein